MLFSIPIDSKGFSILSQPLASDEAGIDELKNIAEVSNLSFKYLELDKEQYWVSSSDRFIVRSEVSIMLLSIVSWRDIHLLPHLCKIESHHIIMS